jgi:hypothetical protein
LTLHSAIAQWGRTTALAALFWTSSLAGAVSPISTGPPAPPSGRWRDAPLDDYREHLGELTTLVHACANARDLKNCDPLLVGPDDRIPLGNSANAGRRLVRYGWLRVLFSKAGCTVSATGSVNKKRFGLRGRAALSAGHEYIVTASRAAPSRGSCPSQCCEPCGACAFVGTRNDGPSAGRPRLPRPSTTDRSRFNG